MKKLLIVALLMLALVITVVACNNDPVEPGTSAEDVTTAETPTEAPDEPDTPAPDTQEPETPAPDTNEPETPAPDTKEPETPAPDTKEPDTEPPVDPADPVWIIDADGLAAMTNANAATVEKNEAGYASFTATGGDPWFLVCGNIGEMPEYMVIRYRTNASQGGEFFIGNGTGPVGGESFLFNYNANGEWNLLIFHLPTVASYMATPTVGYIRYDFYTGGADEGFLDVEYIAFFNTAEYAQAYDFELHKAPHWTEAPDQIKHQSFDQLYAGTGNADNGPENIFTPGASADWDFVVDYSDIAYADFTVDTLTYWGWIGFMGEKGQFGYQIDMNAAVYNDEWAFVGGDHEGIIGAAQGIGADSGHRMKIAISIAGLEGEHTVRAMYKTADGMEICLNEFTVKLPARPTHYDNYNVPQDLWTVTGHCPGIVGKEGHANSGMVAAGGVESGALIHQGAVALGEIDLSKYSKAVIMWGCDNSPVTVGHYEQSANNRIMLVSADVNGTAPAEDTIIAGGTYELGGWAVQAFEIDLTEVDYNGPVYLCIDTLPGTFALFASVEFIGGEIDYSEPDAPIYNDYTANETINWTPNGITVDGAFADWNGLNVSNIPTDKFVSWVGSTPENLSMVTGFAADADYLYGVVYVTDDAVVSGNKVTGGYNGDVMQVAVTMNGKQSWYSFSYKAEGENYIINTANEITEGAELATVAIDGGWLAEFKLPISVLFADAGVTEFTFDSENPWAMQVLVCNLDRDADTETLSSASGTFLGAEAWKDNGFNLTLNWADGIALNTGIVVPEEPVVETLVIPQDQWVISGHCTTLVGKAGHDNSPMVAAGGVDSAALLHQGSIALGEIDLSKYSKVVIYWGSDNGPGTQDLYAKNEHNRFALVNADKNMVMSPAEDTIIAAATYELHGWAVAPFEIDLTGIDYNGPVFLTHDSLAGGFALVYSIEFVA